MTAPTPGLAAIAARIAAATPGPWEVNSTTGDSDWGEYTVYGIKGVDDATFTCDDAPAFAHSDGMNRADADFVAHAREDIPALLDALAAVTAERDQARQILADAPHETDCFAGTYEEEQCTCWKAGL